MTHARAHEIRALLASIEGADRGIRFALMGDLGKIRRRRGGREFFLDFRPYGRVWSNRGIRMTDEETARRLLEQIRGRVAEERRPLDEVLATYLPLHAKPNLVPPWLERWLGVKRAKSPARRCPRLTFASSSATQHRADTSPSSTRSPSTSLPMACSRTGAPGWARAGSLRRRSATHSEPSVAFSGS